MHFVEVLVGSATFHGENALTYSSQADLAPGAIVIIPLKNKHVLGIVLRHVQKPAFKAKSIIAKTDLPDLPLATLELITWIKTYYPSPLGAIVQHFLPKGLPKKNVGPLVLESISADLPSLTSDQQYVLRQISSPGSYVVHGETGTGKTRVYIELAKKTVQAGGSSIILTPEIGLTSQLANNFRAAFGNRVLIIHSQLTEVTKQRLWVQILKQNEPLVILGPRSALFSPVKNLGLIVIDESHESAYKQDNAPYYHASRIASKMAELNKAQLVLGSATPSVQDYYLAEAKKRPILRMTEIATQNTEEQRTLTVVDLKDRSKFTKKSYLSDELIKEMAENIKNNEQTLLFLNRRGTARVVFCEDCGWQATCPHCDLPLVYHGDTHTMRCHSCNYKAALLPSCPDCLNPSVVFKSIGTKAIVDEASRLFPDAQIMRFDTDNKKHERIEQHFDAVRTGKIDILVGTQTLAKGLDLPKLSLVGVVMADTSLYFPDFSSQERTYQLLQQVIGRVGRGHRAGRVIIQTYDPTSPLVKSVINKDWEGFYKTELAERKRYMFPPFCYLLKLHCRRATSKAAEKAAHSLAQLLTETGLRIIIEGPTPAFHEKVQGKFQWQLVIKAKDRRALLRVIDLLPSGWSYDIDPLNLL